MENVNFDTVLAQDINNYYCNQDIEDDTNDYDAWCEHQWEEEDER